MEDLIAQLVEHNTLTNSYDKSAPRETLDVEPP